MCVPGQHKDRGLVMDTKQTHVPDRCEICGDPATEGSLHYDHCHATGLYRGALCASCNKGLGYFRDNTETLHRAIEYLHRTDSSLRVPEISEPVTELDLT
jgi:hypothetical protein